MAKISKLTLDGHTVYPQTVDTAIAVLDSQKTLSEKIKDIDVAIDGKQPSMNAIDNVTIDTYIEQALFGIEAEGDSEVENSQE
jgi:hypothetical protein